MTSTNDIVDAMTALHAMTIERGRERYQSDPQFRRTIDELARLVAIERAQRRTLANMHAGPPTRH